ncbi:unnamed protein product [Effrenium voratum]|uniref:Uncharacterized protein n=1 Tax=Effrenium voratum TaxID=2562239 RepID=A0AA36HLB7_9DINO|nr:unnamed protein product [Effrenium voratum]
MFAGVLKLLRPWLRPCSPGQLLMPARLRVDPEELPGTLPRRVVALTKAANLEDLRLKLQWQGSGEMRCVCLLMRQDGVLLKHVWEGAAGEPGIRYNQQPSREIELEDDEAEIWEGDWVGLQLRKLPESVFGVVFVLAATEETFPWASSHALTNFQELTLTLCRENDTLWRYRQPQLREECNALASCCLYRGSRQSWRLEPMNLAMRLVYIDKARWREGCA